MQPRDSSLMFIGSMLVAIVVELSFIVVMLLFVTRAIEALGECQ